MSTARAQIIDVLWDGRDPFDGLELGPTDRVDHQGLNSHHPYLHRAIDEVKPRIIVEVGVWKGGSVLTMAQKMRDDGIDGTVIAIDTWLGSAEHFMARSGVHAQNLNYQNGLPRLYYIFAANVMERQLQDYVVPLPLDSVNAFHVIQRLSIQPDIIHIDAGHDFQSVTNDLSAWWPVLKPGGILVGDDYFADGSIWPEVQQAFDAFFGKNQASVFESDNAKCFVRKPF